MVRRSNPGGGEIFRTCPDRPWDPPSLLYNGYRVFPGVKSGQGVTLTPQPLLVPWSWKSRAIPLLPQWAVRPVQSHIACTRVHSKLYIWLVDLYVFAMIVYGTRGLCQRSNINDSLSSQLSGSLSWRTCNILLNISVASLKEIWQLETGAGAVQRGACQLTRATQRGETATQMWIEAGRWHTILLCFYGSLFPLRTSLAKSRKHKHKA